MSVSGQDAIRLQGTLEGFLEQAQIWGNLDTAIAVVGPGSEPLFRNRSWQRIDRQLDKVATASGQSAGLLLPQSIKDAIGDCLDTCRTTEVCERYLIDPQLPLKLSLVLRPLLEADGEAACALLVTLADESLAYDRFRFAQAVKSRNELVERVRELSRELASKEEIIRALLKDTPFAVMLVAMDRKVVQVNRAFELMFDTSMRQVLGKPCDAFLYCYQCNNDCPVMEGRRVILQETPGLHPARADMALMRSSVMLTQHGEPLVLEAFFDISPLKEAERERDRYRDHLEELVEERTSELNAANKELEAFCYSVSHDLRGPLRAIDGFSAALYEDYNEALDPTGKDVIRRIRAGTERMGELIDDLLQLSRVTRSEFAHTTTDLSAMAREIVDKLRSECPERHVDADIADGLRVRGDGRLLRIALTNLLDNAWKYTRHVDHARITLGMTTLEGHQVFFVRDNGAGFDMRYVDKVFGVFQRLHRDSEFEGTGIGLAIVQRVIERHGGQVWARSQQGAGATFFFTLRD